MAAPKVDLWGRPHAPEPAGGDSGALFGVAKSQTRNEKCHQQIILKASTPTNIDAERVPKGRQN